MTTSLGYSSIKMLNVHLKKVYSTRFYPSNFSFKRRKEKGEWDRLQNETQFWEWMLCRQKVFNGVG